jgi:hypothetical protein
MIKSENNKLNQLVSDARRASTEREKGYRQKALNMYPHICGRCAREFSGKNLQELTVHHRNHNHDDNPADGSNWELLCLYCHDNEHQRQLEGMQDNSLTSNDNRAEVTYNPFANLKSMMKGDK